MGDIDIDIDTGWANWQGSTVNVDDEDEKSEQGEVTENVRAPFAIVVPVRCGLL